MWNISMNDSKIWYKIVMQNGRINPPRLRPRLSPRENLNQLNMTTGLWSEVLINKIRTRSITFTKAQIIIDSNFPTYNIDLQKESQIKMHKVNHNWWWQTLVLGQRTMNKLYLLLNGAFYNTANIAKTISSMKQTLRNHRKLSKIYSFR
jgi:hypothetical protein